MFQLENTNILPGQQKSLHLIELVLEPSHSIPPHEGLGLSHTLVFVCIPPPQVLLHSPNIHELHPPSTAEDLIS